MAKIQIKRGLEVDLPILDKGELAYTTDTKKLFVGTTNGNERVNPIVEGGSVEITESSTNGSILVNGTSLDVYDDTEIMTQLGLKASSDDITQINSALSNKAESSDLTTLQATVETKADRSEIPAFTSLETLNKLSDNGTGLLFNGSLIGGGGGGGSVSEPEFILKDSWSTTGVKNFGSEMTKIFIHNTGNSDLTFTINSITTTVKSTEKFEGVYDPFTSATVTTSSTFTANVSALKVGSANPLYSIKDYRSGSSTQTFTLPSSRQGLAVSNDGTSTLSYVVNGITVIVDAGEVVEKLFDSFTQVAVTSTVPYRILAKSGFVASNGGVDSTPPTITASPNGGSFNSAQSVSLTSNETATIYYTTDGSTPTISSTVYSTPISISVNTTLKFFGVDETANTSTVQTVNFVIDTVAPTTTISPVAGTYEESQTITLTTNETATVYYTLDGSNPTTGSTVYTSPININNTTTIKYFARDSVGNSEAVKTSVFTINLPDTTPPVITASPSGGTYTASQTVTLTSNEAATIYYSLDGSNPTTSSTVYSSPIEVSATATLKYIGVDSANNTSTVQSSIYTINLPDTTAPEDVTNLNATPTTTSVDLSWTASVSSDVAGYNIYNGTTKLNNSLITGTVYTINDLAAATAYAFVVKAVDSNSNESSGTSVTATTDTIAPEVSLFLSGTATKLQLPSMTLNRIVMDILPQQHTSANQIYADGRTGSTNAYVFRNVADSKDTIGAGTFKVDGVTVANGTVRGVPDNVRSMIDWTFTTAFTDNVTIFADNTGSYPMTGYIYNVKIYNDTTLVAHYDTSQGNVQDQTGNGHHATVTGGSFV